MQLICNLVEKLVRIYHIILIIHQKRKQKAQKRSFLSPQLSEPSNQGPIIKRKKIMTLSPKGKGNAIARRGKAASKSEAAVATDTQQAGIQLYLPAGLPNRPVGPNDFTVSEIVSISGNRPIGTSTLHISETYGIVGNRPVEASNFEVVATLGRRPIGSSAMQVSEMFSMSGARPIAVSTLHIDEVYSTMGGNRPIASNEIDDTWTLMGFLD
jgi:hypothetical protein